MKKVKIISILLCVLLVALFNSIFIVHAEEEIIPEIILTENFIIRDNDTIIFSGAVSLPAPGVVDLNDNAGTPHSINSQNVLSVLHNADILSTDFSISNLEYYSSFDSLYLKCITGIATEQKCDNWQYTVDNTYPGIGMDKKVLSGGENVYIYFGQQYRILLNSKEITTIDALTVTAEEYNYSDNTWKNRTGVTVGLTQPDPNNTWSPIEVKTGTVDENGKVTFLEIPTGSYNVGIKEDYYSPTESLTVTIPKEVVTSGGGGGGGSINPTSYPPPSAPVFNVPKALTYLSSTQSSDGSFGGSDLYTDWAIIALVAGNISDSTKNNIINYMSTHNTVSSFLTDNERHAMALLALGQNPYSFHGMNYIGPILGSFDGTQFGDINLVNDDVFALIPLAKSGYTVDDEIIKKDVAFIISKQKENGSWEDSVDLTGATIQALKPFEQLINVSNPMLKAVAYIEDSQKDSGGWGNAYSTSWALQTTNILKISFEKNGNTAANYLANLQESDGGLLSPKESLTNRIWATSYAIPAILNKSWSEILNEFPKPTPVTSNLNIEVKKVIKVSKKETKTETKIGEVKGVEDTAVEIEKGIEKIEKKESRIISAIKAIVAFFRNL